MKHLIAVLLAVVLCLCSIGTAAADGIDVKVKGTWDFAFGYTRKDFQKSANGGFDRNYKGSKGGYRNPVGRDFMARQRVRTQIDFIASENLSAVLMFEIGDIRWGNKEDGGALDTDGINVETKRAYLDWIIPHTEIAVRMGLQGLYLPSGRMGNPVFTGDVAAVTVSAPITDWLSAVVFWARPFDAYNNDEEDFGIDSLDDETDMFGILLPMSFADWGLSFTPWYVYSLVGNASGFYNYVFNGEYDNTLTAKNSGTKAWWVGANLGFTLFEPLEFNMDVMYGRLNRTDAQPVLNPEFGIGSNMMASGWYIGATLDYHLDCMSPGIFGWYASGDTVSGVNGNRIGRMPVVAHDDGFMATTFGMNGYYSIGNGDNSPAVVGTGTGTWGVGIQLADITFIEDLSHTLRFAYYKGTNEAEILAGDINGMAANYASSSGYFKYASDTLYLTDKEEVFEINFDHQYKIYDNLTAVLELGYIYLKSDRATWAVQGSDLKSNDDAWKAEIAFRYSF